MTKAGNSGSEDEPTKAETPEATPAGTGSAADTSPPPDPNESPTDAPGAPPISSVPGGTDGSGGSDADGEKVHPPNPSESPTGAPGGPPDSTLPASTDSSGSEGAAAPARENLAARKAAEAKAAEDKAAAEGAARPRRPRPLVEKAPPVSRDEALRARAKRRFEEPAPRTLRISLYFFIGAGLVWVLTGVLFLVNKQDYIDVLVADETNTLTPEETASSVTQLLWIYVVVAVVFAVFLGLFGYKATEGTRRARTLVTIIAAITVLFHLLLLQSQPGILVSMFALVGLILLWSPSARNYFPPRQVP